MSSRSNANSVIRRDSVESRKMKTSFENFRMSQHNDMPDKIPSEGWFAKEKRKRSVDPTTGL